MPCELYYTYILIFSGLENCCIVWGIEHWLWHQYAEKSCCLDCYVECWSGGAESARMRCVVKKFRKLCPILWIRLLRCTFDVKWKDLQELCVKLYDSNTGQWRTNMLKSQLKMICWMYGVKLNEVLKCVCVWGGLYSDVLRRNGFRWFEFVWYIWRLFWEVHCDRSGYEWQEENVPYECTNSGN